MWKSSWVGYSWVHEAVWLASGPFTVCSLQQHAGVEIMGGIFILKAGIVTPTASAVLRFS
jgi:hypothetical protein